MRDDLVFTKRELLMILFRRRWQIAGIIATSLVTAVFFAYYLLSPNYGAEATIIINSSYLTQPLRDAPPESDFEKLAGFHTQRDIIESERVATEAVRRTRLAERRVIGNVEKLRIFIHDVRRFVGSILGIERWQKPWSAEAAAIAEVDEWIRTAALPDSKAIRITYRAKDAQEAVDVLNAVVDIHTEYYYGVYRERAAGVVKFLELEFERAAQEIRQSEQALLRFRMNDRLDTERMNAAASAMGGNASFVGITDSTKVQDELKLYVLKLEDELRVAGEIPDNQRRNRVRGEIQRRMKVYLDALNSIPERELELVRLRRRYDAANDDYQILQRNLTRARIVAEGDSNKIRLIEVFERPVVKDDPISPSKRLILVLALLLGSVLAATWAFVAHYFDHTLRTGQDVERYLNLRLIGSLRRFS